MCFFKLKHIRVNKDGLTVDALRRYIVLFLYDIEMMNMGRDVKIISYKLSNWEIAYHIFIVGHFFNFCYVWKFHIGIQWNIIISNSFFFFQLPHIFPTCAFTIHSFYFFLIVYLTPASTTHVDMGMRKTASGHTLKEEWFSWLSTPNCSLVRGGSRRPSSSLCQNVDWFDIIQNSNM